MFRKPLSKQEVIKAIERKGCERVPLLFHKRFPIQTALK